MCPQADVQCASNTVLSVSPTKRTGHINDYIVQYRQDIPATAEGFVTENGKNVVTMYYN